jgi:diguanylate cyclase (GGDEF)-like protein/PAS domain S-box-containing protein/hemerythrin-like metal-binding protein
MGRKSNATNALHMEHNVGSSSLLRASLRPVPVFVVLILVTLLSGNLLFQYLRAGLKQDAQRHIAAVGELKSRQIHNWLEGQHIEARILSGDSFFSHDVKSWMRAGAHDDVKRAQLVKRFNAFLKVHFSRAVVLYDTSGHVMLTAGEPVPDALAKGEAACAAAAAGQLQLVDLHHAQGIGSPLRVGFISPLQEEGRCFGAAYLEDDPASYLFPLMAGWPSDSETAETQLVRADGDKVLYLNQLRFRPDRPMEFTLPMNTPRLAAAIALRGKRGLLENATDYRNVAVLSYATPIKGTPWVLISKMDESEAYRMITRIRTVAVLSTLFIFGLAGAWFWQWHRRDQVEADAAILKERVRADALKIEGEKRFRTVFEHTALPMARNSPAGEFIEVNDAFCDLLGYSHEDIKTQRLTWQQITHPDDLESGASLVGKMQDGGIADFSIEKRYVRKNGSVVWGSVQAKLVRDENGKPEFYITTIQDITERKAAEKAINFMAYHDKLTGLPNRALLFDRLSQAISQAKRDGLHVALLFADLDGFKAVNDKYGHEVGDNVLKMAAQRFLACVRAVDTVARFGGDEFAIILGGLEDARQARGVAEKIVQEFAPGMTLSDGTECSVGASVGISIYPEHGNAMDSLITAADKAMYASKHSGKNSYTFFDGDKSPQEREPWFRFDDSHRLGIAEMDDQHRNLVFLVNSLNDALKRNDSDESIEHMLDELLAATTQHFQAEQRLMSTHNYPEQVEHELEHTRLLNEAMHFRERFTQGRELLVLQSIKDWLLGHIAFSDKKLADYLRDRGLK